MSKDENAVFQLIQQNNMMTAKMIAEKMNKSTKTIYRIIKNLKEQGKIQRVGDDFNGHWEC